MKFIYDKDSTPINGDEINNLIPSHIRTQDELNMWEQNNILLAEQKLFKGKRKIVLSIDFIQKTHKMMFSDTWKWAGKFRQTNMNIGIDWIRIPTELKMLCEDVEFQREQQSFPIDEIAVLFSHRLVAIHPFTNGNGRCSRLIADLLMVKAGLSRFTWGSKNLTDMSETRTKYINALREADNYNILPLMEFAKS